MDVDRKYDDINQWMNDLPFGPLYEESENPPALKLEVVESPE
jgi:hypothetical protein